MRILIATICVLFAAGNVRAATPTVTAVLDNSNTAVGQPVQIQIKIVGASDARAPGEIVVDGLEIRYSGKSQLVEGRNFQFTQSLIYSYTVMPLKAGTFKIPAQAIQAGGTTLRTPKLTLQVSDSGPRSSRGGRTNEPIDPSNIAFVELILSKSNAYVGEMLPAVVRLGFNVRTPVESLGNGVEITGQGFTTQKMREPRQTIETINGRTYQTFTFKTAISPARSGRIEIGPVQVNPVVRIPRTTRNPGIPRDLFDLNDPFMDNFFRDPSFAPSSPHELKLKSEPVTLEVKALPPNAPAGFGGAVGNFTLTVDAKPKSAKVGDPFTVTATLHGRGNFDRVTAPVFEDERGWHKYPPSADFKQDDDVGISGAKTFETVLSPNERKENIPAQLFAFFDPVKEQYVTLRGDPIAVRVEGGAAPSPSPSASVAQIPAVAPAASPASTVKPQGILHQLDFGTSRQTFVPLFARRSFWLAQLLPLLALLAFVAWKLRQGHLQNRDAQRLEALRHEAAELQRSLRRNDATPQEYFARASRAVQLKAALAKNLDPNAVDAEVAALAFRADEETRARLRRLFEKSDEARYSGGQNGIRLVPPESRKEVLDLIENLRA